MKTLSVSKMILLIFAMALVATLAYVARVNPGWPLNEVAVDGDISLEQRTAVFNLLRDAELFDLPMTDIQTRVEQEGWISSAALARRWPDSLVITIQPEKPVALWNNDAYLNEQGEVFKSPFLNQSRLPQLYGPEGEQERVMAQYLQLNNMLFKGGQQIEQLTLDERGNWRFQSNLQIDVLLGKTALMERVQRLLHITDYIDDKGKLGQIKQIDTRYVNGVAVAWLDEEVRAVALQSTEVSPELKLATNYNSQRESQL